MVRVSGILAVFLFSSLAAGASVRCTDLEVIGRVCRTASAITSLCSYDRALCERRDDTGTARALEGFASLGDELSVKGIEVSPADYARLQRVLDQVTSSYEKLADQMSPADRLWHRIRLSTLKLPRREDLSKARIVALFLGANGSYDWSRDTIELTPIVLSDASLSEMELAMLLSHEVGHYLDPDAYSESQLPFRQSQRGLVLSPKLNACFQGDFTPRFPRSEPTLEDYADWMASQVMRDFVSAAPSARSRMERALNAAYAFCPSASAMGKMMGTLDNAFAFMDSHAPGATRILTLMRDPELLDAIGCGPEIESAETGKPLPTCILRK